MGHWMLWPLVVALPVHAADPWRPAAERAQVERDWMLQDYMAVDLPAPLAAEKEAWRVQYLKAPESRRDPPVLERPACFTSESDGVVEFRMVLHAAGELGPTGTALQREAEALRQEAAPGADPRWKRLYLRACELRRAERLVPLSERCTRLVLSKHPHVPHSWKYTEVLSDPQTDRHRYYRPGASIYLVELDGLWARLQPLVEDADGVLRNPDVSYDGKRMLFAWKKSDRGDDFHLYEMDLADRSVRQLTEGEGFADYEGVYLPDGNVLFSSTRCCQTVDCNWVEVSNLYLMDGDGRYLRRVGFDQVHTIFPTVTDDGRVLYTRWEYSDRGQIFPQPLFQMNPDGTNQREFYGNNSWFPTNIIHGRKIPGSRKVLAVVTGHHRPAHGKLAILDPGMGRQEGRGVQLIAPIRPADYVREDRYALDGIQFQYPYPLDEKHFLVAAALPTPTGDLGRFDLYLMDTDGRRELLASGDGPGEAVGCKQAIPLARRPRRCEQPSRVRHQADFGTVFLQDVYQGPGLTGIPRGKIKHLRVVALDYRAGAIGSLSQQGLGGGSEVTTPIAIGNGSWDVKVVLGTTPVHEDGSALFRVPASTPVYFQALDERGDAVQTMRSWTTLMPGEVQSCVGCHEHKNTAPRAQPGAAAALVAGPQELTPFHGPARGFSFAREVQPILDRRCVSCHDGRDDVPLDLTGQPVEVGKTKRHFTRAYLALTGTREDCGDWDGAMVNWIDSMSEPTMLPPYHRGAATSRLLEILRAGHEGVALGREELETIACWIDLLVPFCGDYREASAWSAEEHAVYDRAEAKRRDMQALERENVRALVRSQVTGIRK